MSQAKVVKEDVRRVRDQLKAQGIKPTFEKIRAALGNEGSNSTIQKFKDELEAEEDEVKYSPEAVDAFHKFWDLGIQEGRSQCEDKVQDIKQTNVALTADIARAESDAAASRRLAEDAAKKLEVTLAKLNGTIDELAKAREASERYASKLVEAGEMHNQELKKLRDQAEKDNEQYREECGGLRLQLTTIGTEHRLEVERLRAQAEKANELHREEIKELRGQAEKANVQHRGEIGELQGHAEKAKMQYRQEIDELRARLDAEKELVSNLRVKLATAEAMADRRRDDLTPEESVESLVPKGRHRPATP